MQPIEELPFIAGHMALDFVNTAEQRGHPDAGDALRTPSDLRRWGQRYGLLSASASAEDEREELRRAVDTRELLYALLLARVHGRPPAEGDLERLAASIPPAYAAARLQTDADGRLIWSWDRTRTATIRHIAASAAVELLARTPPPRLKQCPGDHCGWLFIDNTKRGNRRWCSMSECGQDAKTARRRSRSATQRSTQVG